MFCLLYATWAWSTIGLFFRGLVRPAIATRPYCKKKASAPAIDLSNIAIGDQLEVNKERVGAGNSCAELKREKPRREAETER